MAKDNLMFSRTKFPVTEIGDLTSEVVYEIQI